MLSEEAKIKRRRRTNINVQMTVFSWSLELITSLVALSVIVKLPHPESNVDFITCMVIVDAGLNFIIIPSSYTLHTEAMKALVIAEGWCKFLRSHLPFNKVNPI